MAKSKYVLTVLLAFPLITLAQTMAPQAAPPMAMTSQPKGVDSSFRVSARYDETCREPGSTDRFETPWRISEFSHNFAGKCLDTDKMRPLKIIKKDSYTMRIANFEHNGKFWIADLPLLPIAWDKVIVHTVLFPTVPGLNAAHSQIRFKLKPGYKIFLRSQEAPVTSMTVQDIILTSQTSAVRGEADNMALGTFDNYPIVTRAISLQERIRESKNVVNQYETTIEPKDIPGLLVRGVQESQSRGYSTFYNILRPNCVTEVFDLIQTLPQLKNKSRFFTVLSGDPVAGPAVAKLREWGIYGTQLADLSDELSGRSSTVAKPQTQAIPYNYFRDSSNMPYTLIEVEPVTKYDLSPIRTKLGDLAQKAMMEIPLIVQGMGTASFVNGNAKKVMVQALSQVQRDLYSRIVAVNDVLPENDAVDIMLYFVPWKEKLPYVTLQDQGVPAALPFAMKKYQNQGWQGLQRLYNTFYANLSEKQVIESNKKPGPHDHIFFLGAALHLRLQRDRSVVTVQILNHLNPQVNTSVRTKTPQMEVAGLVIPASEPDTTNRPTLLITYSSRPITATRPEINTDVDFEFGGIGTIDAYGPGRGFLRTMTELSCYRRAAVTPYLSGWLGPQVLDRSNNGRNNMLQRIGADAVNAVAKDNAAFLNFFNVRLNIGDADEPAKVTAMNMRVTSVPFKQCESMPAVTDSVQASIDESLDNAIVQAQNRLTSQSVFDVLLSNLPTIKQALDAK